MVVTESSNVRVNAILPILPVRICG